VTVSNLQCGRKGRKNWGVAVRRGGGKAEGGCTPRCVIASRK